MTDLCDPAASPLPLPVSNSFHAEAEERIEANQVRRLWCAVILRMLEDALGRNMTDIRGNQNRMTADRRRIIDEGRSWFVRGGRDFRMTCCLADLDPDAVQERALGLIAVARQLEALAEVPA